MGIIVTLFVLGILVVGIIIWAIVYLVHGKNNAGQSVEFDKSIKLIYMFLVTLVMFFACVGFAIYAIIALGRVLFPAGEASIGYEELIPALVGVVITLPIFLYHFKQTKPREER